MGRASEFDVVEDNGALWTDGLMFERSETERIRRRRATIGNFHFGRKHATGSHPALAGTPHVEYLPFVKNCVQKVSSMSTVSQLSTASGDRQQ